MTGTRKILVLYTSGMLYMRDLGRGYEVLQNSLEANLRSNALFHDAQCTNAPPGCLVLPQLRPQVAYRVLQYCPVIDSSDMSVEMYEKMATDVYRNYREYDGFIILHGTDTLAYTAAALSFMCENLGKPILLTGSQLPLKHLHSDARNNLLEALETIGRFTIPEVIVLFDHALFRGNRVCKTNSTAFHAFESPNMEPLAKLGVSIDVNWPMVLKPTKLKPFSVWTRLSRNVIIIRVFPTLSLSVMAAHLGPPIEGVVLQTLGTGKVASLGSEMLDLLRAAIARGVIVVNVTQCLRGPAATLDMGACGNSSDIESVCVCPGHDLTAEAAVAKLMYVCGKPWTHAQKLRAMQRPLRGEFTMSDDAQQLSAAAGRRHLEKLSDTLGLQSVEKAEKLQMEVLPMLMTAAIKEENTGLLMQLGNFVGHFQIADNTGRTPLHHAAHFGSVACTELLLRNGALVNQTDSDGVTPLEIAARLRHDGVIRLLRDTGSQLPAANPHELGRRLCALAAVADVAGIASLLAAGADVNAADYAGRRALHLAVRRGHRDVVRHLVRCGADPDAVDALGRSPRDEAAGIIGHDDDGGLIGELFGSCC